MAFLSFSIGFALLESYFLSASGLGPKLASTSVNGYSLAGSQPKPRAVDVFTKYWASIGCTFVSKDSVKVFWYKDGNVTTGRRRTDSQEGTISKHQLILSQVKEKDAGIYRCVGKSGNVTGDSASFKVNVIGESKPVFRENFPPSKLVLYRGQSKFDLKCNVTNYHYVKRSWGKESGLFHFSVLTIKGYILRFTTVTSKSAGNYTCKASNKIGKSYKTVNVVVVNNPSWREKPKAVSVALNQPFEVSASFDGSGSGLRVSWFKGDVALTNSAQLKLISNENRESYYKTIYKVKRARIQDTGTYTIKVHNFNDKISAETEVFVISKPKVVIENSRELTTHVGGSIELACEVEGYPTPSATWESDGAVLARNSVNSGKKSHKIKSKLILVIPSVKSDKKYTCSAKNQYGHHQESIFVRVVGTASSTPIPNAQNQDSEKSSNDTMIIIVAVAGGLVLIIILISVSVVHCKKKRDNDSQISAIYKRAVESVSDRGDDEEVELISDSMYMTPIKVLMPQQFNLKRSPGKTMSIRRQNLLTSSVKCNENSIYADILPPGQGRRLQFEDMNLGQICGSGNFGVVVRGTLDEEGCDSKDIAVKMLKETAGLSERKMMLDELQMLKSLSPHPNIVGLIGWCITDDNVYIVEEFVPNGTLLQYLRSKRNSFYSHYINLREVTQSKCDAEFILFAWQIASGMKYLSSQSIIHRDLASRNVLLGHESVCKIADFGLARAVYQNAGYKKSGAGQLPVRWMAPESIFNNSYSKATDVWSFGIVLWEIATLGDIPYPNLPKVEHLLTLLKNKRRMPKPSHCSDTLYNLMKSCWEELPGERPDFEVISYKLGKMINDDSVFLDIPRFFIDMDKEVLAEEDVFDVITEPNPSDTSDRI